MVYLISKYVMWPIFSIFIKKIDGLENLPNTQAIYVANHQSYIDGPLIVMLLAWHKNEKVYTFALNNRFLGPISNLIMMHFGAIRIKGSIVKALQKVAEGGSLSLFPEGERGHSRQVAKVTHNGLGVLACKTKLPIVPIGLDTYDFWGRKKRFPNLFKQITITIGKPHITKLKPTNANYKKVVERTMREVKKLAKQSYPTPIKS